MLKLSEISNRPKPADSLIEYIDQNIQQVEIEKQDGWENVIEDLKN